MVLTNTVNPHHQMLPLMMKLMKSYIPDLMHYLSLIFFFINSCFPYKYYYCYSFKWNECFTRLPISNMTNNNFWWNQPFLMIQKAFSREKIKEFNNGNNGKHLRNEVLRKISCPVKSVSVSCQKCVCRNAPENLSHRMYRFCNKLWLSWINFSCEVYPNLSQLYIFVLLGKKNTLNNFY